MLFLLQGLYEKGLGREKVVFYIHIRKFNRQWRGICAVFMHGNLFGRLYIVRRANMDYFRRFAVCVRVG